MDETISYILNNYRTKIKISDYLTILVPTIGIIVGGLAMINNAYHFNHPDLLLPGIIAIVSSIIIMLISLRKLSIENTYDLIKTGLPTHQNIQICEQMIKELFKPDQIFGDKGQGLLYFNIDSIFSWGKQITLICSENQILLNCHDIRGPFSLVSRRIYMNKIKERIKIKLCS